MQEETTTGSSAVGATEISATDLRTFTRDILERVKFRGERFLVHTHGRPMAMIVAIEEFGELKKENRSGGPQAYDV
jgi:prevent-host-death family protein